eukprot:g33954.t1
MLRESVTESVFGLSDVEETTSGAMDAVDQEDLKALSFFLSRWSSIGYVEQYPFRCYTDTIPHLFLCYIDDYISAASCSHEELEQLIHFTNTFHPNLKLNWTSSETSVPFLDLSVSISGNRVSTDIYFKSIDLHSYVNHTSSHPCSCKNVIPYSQFLRLYHTCSWDEVFHSQASQMFSYFKDHNFSSPVIHIALKHISCISHTSVLKPPPPNNNKDRVLLVLTDHSTILRVQHIILHHFSRMQSDPTTKEIFPAQPLSVFHRDRTLCEFL